MAVAGAAGKMGRRILTLAQADPDFQITGALEREETEALGVDVGTLTGSDSVGVKVTADITQALDSAEVLVDFTHASAVEKNLAEALKQGAGLVIGTTGLSEKTLRSIQKASRKIAILQSPNMSAGVNSLFELVSCAARILGEGYDVEITEIHHGLKKDAPSGTALELARLVAEARKWDAKKSNLFGRHGETGERKRDELGIHALRGGDMVGEHTVYFLGRGEVIELAHRATSRDAFARGALLAAKFIARKKKGFYNMRDVLQS